ncbi:LytR/AlgR family response regulator transcription factor [Maribacter chungangensis]|uniref:LytR/AlgR family response regulator transcription factor n=1 Tax=Maribacter chungangensis TaxID=1069117 RepID=A0ABW3B0L8_9FLAO
MKTLNCIIADDEPIARQILESYVANLPYLSLVASCANAFEVMEVLQKDSIDVLFLDINMPKLSGLSLLKTMQQKPYVIITTAYPEYAVEGFELSVTDYLLKPFSLERFLKAISKVQQLVQPNPTLPETTKEDTTKTLFVKSDKKIIKLNLKAITHIEAYGNYIKIFTDAMVLTPQTLTEFLEKLPSNFLRIHKSFAINFDQLKLIDGNQVVLQNETKLPIGKSYRKIILDRI